MPRRPRRGSAFSFKDFHKQALDLGGVGLDTLKGELLRLNLGVSLGCGTLERRFRDFYPPAIGEHHHSHHRRWP